MQNVHKQAQVRKTCKEKKVGMLRASRSIQKVKYKFKLADFVKDSGKEDSREKHRRNTDAEKQIKKQEAKL